MLHRAQETDPANAGFPAPSTVERLNQSYADAIALDVLHECINQQFPDRIALVSSFGAESVVLLHLVSQVDRGLPVIFIDTHFHFKETLDYQKSLANELGLTNLVIAEPEPSKVMQFDPGYDLHKSNPDQCCALRKTAPLKKALTNFDAWITGRKRHQNAERANLELFEQGTDQKFKVNPLAYWSIDQIKQYILDHELPRHPLVKSGYPSIGCEPCTTKVREGDDPRSGRWQGTGKQECGIHIEDGKIVREVIPTIAADNFNVSGRT